MYFKLKPRTGNHAQTDKDGNVVIFTAKEGRVIKSKTDLAKKYPTKFERVNIAGEKELETVQDPDEKTDVQLAAEEGIKDIMPEDDDDDFEDEDEEEKPKKKKKRKKKKAKSLGKDVSSKFPKAEEEDYKVFYTKGKGYFVTDHDDPTVPLHEERFKKSEVMPFVEEQLED